ncbi:MAG: asparagine synthase (glutamine-hydrolyzing) [Bacteroidota bacterium]
MCGIAGYYSPAQSCSPDELENMTACIAHRGPDADGFFSDSHVGLAHRRLKIIDLSDAANQPMTSQSGRFVIVYNGEIYNYNDLRREYQLPVTTNSDTEVLLELLELLGVEQTLSLCNGMFSFALYDTHIHKLFLARDRMGIKPLFYFWDGHTCAFASEMKSLRALKYVQEHTAINSSATSFFLHMGYTGIHDTIYTHIHKLPAGNYAVISEDGFHLKSYWDISKKITSSYMTDFVQARETLRDLVESSVRYRLQSDVDFGCFLSGGIDSSLVAAVAQQNMNSKLKTFTIGFENAQYAEQTYAHKVADFLGTEHHELILSEQDAFDKIEQFFSVYDEPYADSSAIPTMLVSELASQHVSMTLSGDGGDELYMGYGAYNWAERLHKPFWRHAHTCAGSVLQYGTDRHKRAGKVFLYPSADNIPSHIFSQEQGYFSRSEIDRVLSPDISRAILIDEQPDNLNRILTPAENQAFFDMRYYLCEDLLTKVDRASMHYSIESRVPLLDHTLVEFALNLSPELKKKGDVSKYLLKQVLYEYIPAELFDRPKWGFSIPLQRWLRGKLQYLIHDYLSKESIESVGIFNYPEVERLIHLFLYKNQHHIYNRLWLMILMQRFVITYNRTK